MQDQSLARGAASESTSYIFNRPKEGSPDRLLMDSHYEETISQNQTLEGQQSAHPLLQYWTQRRSVPSGGHSSPGTGPSISVIGSGCGTPPSRCAQLIGVGSVMRWFWRETRIFRGSGLVPLRMSLG
ncbi:hypothetical protein Vafri_1222 [Volvox africanus]|nr:hypothetical protein Vafri_1222 [Volvox africanus]